MTNLFYSEMTPNEQIICFQGLVQVLYGSDYEFS